MTTRLAMWSGPRNISTAMMRSFAARPDTTVSDEPLYAHYLSTLTPEARIEHPAAAEVMQSQPTDWHKVAAHLTSPCASPVWYQKHMAHHLTPAIDRAWLRELTNAFLIRNPAQMIASFIKVIPNPTPADLGLPQQVALFDELRTTTAITPPVFDSTDILKNPAAGLRALCEAVNIPYTDAMLTWPKGPHPADGVWAPHWYASVYDSTTFAPYTPPTQAPHDLVPKHLHPVLDECRALYAHLAQHRTMQ